MIRYAVQFAWSVIDDHRVQVSVTTPVTRVGTLHRLTAAIYVLGMDIVSGNVLTESEDGEAANPDGAGSSGELVSRDNFVLRLTQTKMNNFPMHEITGKLGVMMETILQKDVDPAALLAEHSVQPPDATDLFAEPHTIRFTEVAGRNMTQMYVESKDRTGLLYHLTQVLARENVNIWNAVIVTTDTGVTEDSFYLQHEGRALSESFAAELRAKIEGKS